MTKKKNPHNWLTALDPPRDEPPRRWVCNYCKTTGLFDEVQAIECTYVYPPCTACGQTPECAIDCPGMAEALGATPVGATYLAHSDEPFEN